MTRQQRNEDCAKLAAALAKALGLREYPTGNHWYDSDEDGQTIFLGKNGDYLFDSYWFKRAVEWLLTKGGVCFDPYIHRFVRLRKMDFQIECPAVEFPVRCIAKLMESEDD